MDKKPLFSDLSFITKSNNLQDGDFQIFNTISFVSWRAVLLMEGTRVPG